MKRSALSMLSLILVTSCVGGIALYFAPKANAVTVTARTNAKSEYINWETAAELNNDYVVSSAAEIYSSLTPTSLWLPVASPQTKTITLVGPSGDKITTEIEVVGFTYDWNGASFSADSTSGNSVVLPNGVSACKGYSKSGTTVNVFSSSTGECVGKDYFKTSGSEQTPFFFVRPIFRIKNQSTWLSKFKDKDYGTYTGTTQATIEFRYYYYLSNFSSWTYRNLDLPFQLQVHVDKTNSIDKITVVNISAEGKGDGGTKGHIGAVPKSSEQSVSGKETEFKFTVKGRFDTGINMTFHKRNSQFAMFHEDYATNSGTINMDIRCDGCSGVTDIVQKGVAKNISDVPVKGSGNELKFSVFVGYGRQEFKDVHTGRYTGAFSIVFGLGI